MLETLAPLVLPGGSLTYSVCTFDRQECEAVVEGFLRAHANFRIEHAASAPAAGVDKAPSPVPARPTRGLGVDHGSRRVRTNLAPPPRS